MKWHPPALLRDLEMRKRRKGQGLIYTPPKEGTGNSSPPLQGEVQSALFSNTYISLEAQVNISKKCRAGHLLKMTCLPFHSHSLQLRVSQKLSQPWPKTGARLRRRQERVFLPALLLSLCSSAGSGRQTYCVSQKEQRSYKS